MKRFLTWALAIIGVFLIAFVIFYFWASSSVHDEASYAQVRSYAAEPLNRLPDTLAVATYNIGYLSGMTNNRPIRESETFYAENLRSARKIMRDMRADVIGFQEIDFGSRRSYYYQQMDSLAVTADYPAGALAVNWDARYVPFPYGAPRVNFGRMLSGQAVLSRLPIERQERIVLEVPPNPFWYNAFYLDRLAQIVYLDTDPRLAVINVHLEAFHRETRERQAEALYALVDSLAADHALLLIGDFNAVPGLPRTTDSSREDGAERTMTLLTGHEVLAAVYESDLLDIATGTYPADRPERKIDHILYDVRHFVPVGAAVLDAPGPPADHRPVVARFVQRDVTVP